MSNVPPKTPADYLEQSPLKGVVELGQAKQRRDKGLRTLVLFYVARRLYPALIPEVHIGTRSRPLYTATEIGRQTIPATKEKLLKKYKLRKNQRKRQLLDLLHRRQFCPRLLLVIFTLQLPYRQRLRPLRLQRLQELQEDTLDCKGLRALSL